MLILATKHKGGHGNAQAQAHIEWLQLNEEEKRGEMEETPVQFETCVKLSSIK
jgi:hypothetical protein